MCFLALGQESRLYEKVNKSLTCLLKGILFAYCCLQREMACVLPGSPGGQSAQLSHPLTQHCCRRALSAFAPSSAEQTPMRCMGTLERFTWLRTGSTNHTARTRE